MKKKNLNYHIQPTHTLYFTNVSAINDFYLFFYDLIMKTDKFVGVLYTSNKTILDETSCAYTKVNSTLYYCTIHLCWYIVSITME